MASENKVVKAGVGYLIGNWFIKGLVFLTTPIFARLLSTSEYGLYNTYMSYEAILSIIVSISIHVSLRPAKHKYEKKIWEYTSSCIYIVLFSALVWFVVGNLVYPFFQNWFGFERWIYSILIIHCTATSILQIYNVLLGLEYQSKRYVMLAGINAVGNIGLSVILIQVFFNNNREIGRIIGTAVPITLVSLYIVIIIFRSAKARLNVQMCKYAMTYSLPLVFHGVSQVVLNQFDRIMINHYIGSEEAGIYSFAYNIYTIVFVTVTSIDSVWAPWFFEKMKQKEYFDIRKKGNTLAFGMLLFVVVMILLSPEIVVVLGTEKYRASVYCVIPIVASGYFSFLYLLVVQTEYYYEKTKYISIGTVGAAFVNIILNYIYINKLGYVAAAYTTLVSYILYFIFHYFISRKIHGGSIIDIRTILKYTVGLLILCGITIVFLKYIMLRWIIAGIIGFYFVYWLWVNLKIKEKIKKR